MATPVYGDREPARRPGPAEVRLRGALAIPQSSESTLAAAAAAVGKLVAATGDAEVLQLAAEQIAVVLDASEVWIALVDYQPEWLVLRHALGRGTAHPGQRWRSDVGSVGQVVQGGEPLRLSGSALSADADHQLPLATLGSALVAALRCQDEVLGVVVAGRSFEAVPFSTTDEHALQVLAGVTSARLAASTEAAALRARAQELAVLGEQWRPPLDQAGDFVIVVKNRTNVIDADAAACRILDYTREQLLQLELKDFIPLPSWTDRVDNLGGIREQMMRDAITFDTNVRRRDGSLIPARLQLRAFRQADGFVSRGVVRDLSREKRAQVQALQAEKMHLLQELGSGLAHEVNTPLAVVLGNVEMALSEPLSADVQTMLTAARSAGQRIADTVQSIHRFARPVVPAAWSTIELGQLTWEVIEETRPEWEAAPRDAGRTIRVERDLPAMPPVRGDLSELREAVRELLVNAVQALLRGGTIGVTTSASEDQVRLTVADDGIGMTDEVKQFCLSPFYTTHRPQATGLGLTRVYHTALRHRGHLQIDSAPDEGTRVTLSLPRTASD